MKSSITFATFILAYSGSITAAPTTIESDVVKRDEASLNNAIAVLNTYTQKRSTIHEANLAKRDYAIVTEILSYINSTNLAPEIITGLVDDTSLQPIITDALIAILKSGYVNLGTLLTALNESGLTDQLIQTVISNCEFYAVVYKIALKYIKNLASEIASALKKRSYIADTKYSAADLPAVKRADSLEKRASTNPIVLNLLESLKESGLAASVVDALVTDESFLSYGASLIQQLFSSGALTLSEVITAVEESGTIPLLFDEIFNLQNIETVIVNALAAASGNCGSTTSSLSDINTSVTRTASTSPVSTGTSPSNCKKRRKRSYNY